MNKNTPVQAIKLDECGLVRLFGELEARIMHAVWELEEATVNAICQQLGENCNYKTIMTVAKRLVDKGVLERCRQGRAFVYTPVMPREAFLENISQQTVVGLLNDFGDAAMTGLALALDQMTPEQLLTLRQLIDDKLQEQ